MYYYVSQAIDKVREKESYNLGRSILAFFALAITISMMHQAPFVQAVIGNSTQSITISESSKDMKSLIKAKIDNATYFTKVAVYVICCRRAMMDMVLPQ